jgi:hypothetical protein
MSIINGKGYYIWKIPNCEGGDPDAIASVAQQAGLGHVFIKIANGIYDYNYDSSTKKDLIGPVCEALLAKGIRIWGWHYVFGDLPKEEAKAAIRQINKLPLDGYIIDAEGEYKDKYTPCRVYMNELRAALPDFPIALASYRYPNYHLSLPWKDFLTKCNFNMPQVYWEQSHNPGEQLLRSVKEFQLIEPFRPIIPTGAAYAAGGWVPTVSDVLDFLNTAVSLDMPAVSFWSWDYCRAKLPELWQAISSFTWPGTTPVVQSLPELFVEYINKKNVPLLLTLYNDDAVFVTARQTIQGKNALNGWFSNLLTTLLPDAEFSIASISGTEITKKVTWKVTKTDNTTLTIEDTIGLHEKKIMYHYSSIQY